MWNGGQSMFQRSDQYPLARNSQFLSTILSLEVYVSCGHSLLAFVKVVLGWGALFALLACCRGRNVLVISWGCLHACVNADETHPRRLLGRRLLARPSKILCEDWNVNWSCHLRQCRQLFERQAHLLFLFFSFFFVTSRLIITTFGLFAATFLVITTFLCL